MIVPSFMIIFILLTATARMFSKGLPSTLLNVQKLLTLTQSMIQFMRWLVTRQDTEKHSRDFLKDTSAKNKLMKRRACTALRFLF